MDKFICSASALIVVEFLIIIFVYEWLSLSISSLIMILAIITFFGMLILGYISSTKIDTGEARRAVLGVATVVYFTLLAVIGFTDIGPSEEQQTWIVHDFTILYGVIIGFYFGTKTIDKNSETKHTHQTIQELIRLGGPEAVQIINSFQNHQAQQKNPRPPGAATPEPPPPSDS